MLPGAGGTATAAPAGAAGSRRWHRGSDGAAQVRSYHRRAAARVQPGGFMSRAVRVNATMDQELLRRIDAFAASRYEDRSTAMGQLVDFAVRELQKRDALEAYRTGRVTLREFARALGLIRGAPTTCCASRASRSPRATGARPVPRSTRSRVQSRARSHSSLNRMRHIRRERFKLARSATSRPGRPSYRAQLSNPADPWLWGRWPTPAPSFPVGSSCLRTPSPSAILFQPWPSGPLSRRPRLHAQRS